MSCYDKYLQKQPSKVFCDVKKLFLEISQIHKKTPVPEPFLKKLNTSGRLLLNPVGGCFPHFLCVQSFNLLLKLHVINLNKAAEIICKSKKKVEEFQQTTVQYFSRCLLRFIQLSLFCF